MTIAPERREEFSPGLDPELLALIQATAEVEIAATKEHPASRRGRVGVASAVPTRLPLHQQTRGPTWPPMRATKPSPMSPRSIPPNPENLDPRDTDHPTGTQQAAENAANDPPS